MTQTAERPWWADVQHLRPVEDGGDGDRAPSSGRFDRPTPPTRRPTADHRAARVSARAAAAERHADMPKPRGGTPQRYAEAHPHRPEPEDWLEPTPAPKPARRTIEIRGQVDRVAGVAPVPSPGPQRHRGRMAHERVGPRPDRVALWAVLLGLLLILVAAISSPGADAAAIGAGWL